MASPDRPPSVGGIELRATHVTSSGNKVYVSYAKEGEVFAGGLDILNVTDPAAPKLELRALFGDTDIYASAVMGDRVFLSGARNPDISGLSRPSVLLELIGSKAKQTPLPGWAGTGLAAVNGLLFMTGGNAACVGTGVGMGGSGVYSPTLSVMAFDAHCNAQSIATNGSSTVVALSGGQQGKLRVYGVLGDTAVYKTIEIGAVTPRTDATPSPSTTTSRSWRWARAASKPSTSLTPTRSASTTSSLRSAPTPTCTPTASPSTVRSCTSRTAAAGCAWHDCRTA
ncbi:MAG: hypothetical protein HC933_19100 [Pleurocapsa sp. SU_196_0]|nr:hypothetical protein [Pleurocapsa sp. SU_196_0]